MAAALLLMAVQGTPLTRFGSGDHSFEFVRRKLGRELIEQGKLEENGEAAQAYTEAAEIVEPSIASNIHARAALWEAELIEALTRISGSHVRRGHLDYGVDLSVRYSETTIGVIVKYADQYRHPIILPRLQDPVIRMNNRVSPLLIIANDADPILLISFTIGWRALTVAISSWLYGMDVVMTLRCK
ncbi:hypothetical protein ACWDSJ_09240 [Nocardia sp. NPDC003482]